jgi:hypothetical protein
VRRAFLPAGRGRLELFDYHENPARHKETDAGMRHLAFEVEDVET